MREILHQRPTWCERLYARSSRKRSSWRRMPDCRHCPNFDARFSPSTSDMVATAPLRDQLNENGWTGNICVADAHMMVHYYRTTRDGRIAFGKGRCSHAYIARISLAFEDPGPRIARTARTFRRINPPLEDVPFTDFWTGSIDRSETNSPFFGHLDRNPIILYADGYSGTGVGPSYLGQCILASTTLAPRDARQESSINRGPQALSPYDPIRYFGGNHACAAMLCREADPEADRAHGPVVSLLTRFVPSELRETGPQPPPD